MLEILILLIVVGLKCYQCQLKDGVGDEGCDGNPPDEKYLRECGQPQCWLRYSNDGTEHVERFCVAVADNANGCMPVMVEDNNGHEHSGMECKCNQHDGCNMHSSHSRHHGSGSNGRHHNYHHNYHNY